MRIAGRSPAGKARAIQTDETGKLQTNDDLVLQKLEELSGKVDRILDGTTPVPTQVTGSTAKYIEEVRIEDGLEIIAGASGYINIDTADFKQFTIGVRVRSNKNHQIKLTYQVIIDGSPINEIELPFPVNMTAYRVLSSKTDVLSTRGRIRLENRDSEDHIYRVILYKIK